jgi:molybdenum cofactor cytidylyltransferase
MGQQKQLLSLGSLTVIEHCINAILSAGVSDVVVVIGSHGTDVSSAIAHLPVTLAVNPDIGSDMAASVRVGLNVLKDSSSSVMVCLADHPLVRSETLKSLVARHQANPASIIIPSCNRQRGHPTLFPRKIIQEIFKRNSLREIIAVHAGMIVYENTEDEGVLLDMDTPQDYERILRKFSNKEQKEI